MWSVTNPPLKLELQQTHVDNWTLQSNSETEQIRTLALQARYMGEKSIGAIILLNALLESTQFLEWDSAWVKPGSTLRLKMTFTSKE